MSSRAEDPGVIRKREADMRDVARKFDAAFMAAHAIGCRLIAGDYWTESEIVHLGTSTRVKVIDGAVQS